LNGCKTKFIYTVKSNIPNKIFIFSAYTDKKMYKDKSDLSYKCN